MTERPLEIMNTENRVNILLVDDEASNRVALAAVIESLGQTIVQASSGEEALRYLLDRDFAVILLDVHMPGLSGIETAALVRERESSRQIPIIFLTGADRTAEMMFKGYSTGAVDYLMKPVVAEVLRAKVEVFIELAVARLNLQQEMAERERVAGEISRLNLELEERNADLLAANADLETFSHSVSHDLRAPLRHIQGYLSLLEESVAEKLTGDDLRKMGLVKDAARRMSQLIDDLLSFARAGRAELRRKQFSMQALLQETLRHLQPDIGDRNVEWVIAALPLVYGDANLLRQVWANLLSNALKYTRPRDPARIEVGYVEQGKEIIFHVRDNGVGFNMEYAQNLFGVFQRLHNNSQFEGTGVGLANVRRIVQRHGGRTWAEGKMDQGAVFFFTLPAR